MTIRLALPDAVFPWWMYCVLLPPLFVVTLIPSALLFIFVERPFSLGAPAAAHRPPVSPAQAT